MRIGFVYPDQFPPQLRIENELRALARAGFQVELLAQGSDSAPLTEDWNGARLWRVAQPSHGLWCKVRAMARDYLCLFTFVSTLWRAAMLRFARERQVEVLTLHNLGFASDALWVGRRLGVPVVLDLHENYPANVQSTAQDLGHGWLYRRYFHSLKRWQAHERACVRAAAHTIVVVEEAKERLVTDYGCPPEQITVVSNTEEIGRFLALPIDENIRRAYADRFTLSYVGSYSAHRGLDTVIAALPRLAERVPNVLLSIVGAGQAHERLQRQVAAMGLNGRVEFRGWQPFDAVPSYMTASAAGLVPHHSNPQTEATVPHKLFQYMLLGIPVIVSSCRPLRRIVEEADCGLVFRASDPDDFARCAAQLTDEALRAHLGANGRRAALEKYNWENSSQTLVALYQRLDARRGRGARKRS